MDEIRKEAYSIIYKVLKDHHKSEILLEKAVKKITDDKDRAFLYHLVRGTIKMYHHLDFTAKSFTEPAKYSQTDLKIKVILYLGLYQIKFCQSVPDHAAVDETVKIAKHIINDRVADFVNAILRSYLRNPDITIPTEPAARISYEYSFPEDLVKVWLDEYGEEETELLCMYFNENPSLSFRVNSIATTKNKLRDFFLRKEIAVTESPFSQMVLISDRVYDVLNDVSFNEGYYSIQDSSAAMVVELLFPEADESILDLFAGPGGKCTYMAELMQNTGEIIAVDRFPHKIKRIKQALHRLQITNMTTVAEDALKFGPRIALYDKVLLDVPCSGWGVLQKKPELRWQFNQDMASLLKLQENALDTGSQFVKQGGSLIYSTCTMNRRENEEQVNAFLASKKNFKLIDAALSLPSQCCSNGFLKTKPHRDLIDGAFAAKLQRIK